VGAIDCTKVLVDAAKLANGDASALLALTIRERLMPRFLHDLGNAVQVATLADQLDDSEVAGFQEAMVHAGRLIEHMRRLYVSEPAEVAPFDPVELAQRLEPMLRLAAHPSSFQLCVGRAGTLHGAPWRLERVLLNLVLNASAATGEGRVQLDVGRKKDAVVIEVDDDGPGFVPCYRDDPGLRGHGLGVVRRQVALLGGEVALGASPLGGARVTLRFPCLD
jgi:signal transduction histidine kinase